MGFVRVSYRCHQVSEGCDALGSKLRILDKIASQTVGVFDPYGFGGGLGRMRWPGGWDCWLQLWRPSLMSLTPLGLMESFGLLKVNKEC